MMLKTMTTDTKTKSSQPDLLLPLENGDRLTRAEFEHRYALHPEIKHAELIEGVVYVSSPVHLPHGKLHLYVGTFIGYYLTRTPGLHGADNVSVRLDADNAVQPDICAWFEPQYGGRVQAPQNKFVEGAPDFIIEIASSSAAYDLHDKRHVYRRNQVQEYVVLTVLEKGINWFVLEDGAYKRLAADDDNIYRSKLFPGLWFHADAFWQEDWDKVWQTLEAGMRSEAYQSFAQTLRSKK